jgi:hypothetical protein
LHPEENAARRYLRGVATHSVGFRAAEAEREEEDDAPEPVDPHPLVHNDARNSMVDSKKIVWPQKLTPGNSGPSGLKRTLPHLARELVMFPILGAAVCDLYPGLDPVSFVMRSIFCKVYRGPWRFSLQEREEFIEAEDGEEERGNRQKGTVRSSWFKILASDVPHYVRDPDAEPAVAGADGLYLFGRIRRFAQLSVPAWRAEPFRLAKVLLYEKHITINHMGLFVIDTARPLQFMHEGQLENIEYVQVKDLAACIAVAPVMLDTAVRNTLYFVLGIQL